MFDFSDLDDCIKALKSEDPMVRASASRSLAIFTDKKSLKALMGALKDDNATVRSNAVRSLGTRGDARATDSIIKCLEEDEEEVKIRAAEIISIFGINDKSIKTLKNTLNEPSKLVQIWTLYSLVKLGEEEYFDRLLDYAV